MAYGIWLSWANQTEGFQLPVNPGSIEMSDGSKSKTYDVVGLGEINVIKNPQLTEYTFSGIFPARKYPFVVDLLPQAVVNGQKMNGYVYFITKWMATNRPIRFIMKGDRFDINTPASIESFNWKESGGSGDIEYTIKLKKYVFYAPQKVVVNTTAQTMQKASPERQNEKPVPQTYALAAGENLWTVSKKLLGNGDRWREIQKLNDISDAKLKSLPVGLTLKIPEVTA